ncbi:MAG: tetratricopeptide repeat protein [Desulfovibrio sp.]|nr:tetratricopeptide repeat protein [Desulfovibrio sp.]
MADSIPFWLHGAEIARLENAICAELREFIKFDSHALYFSQVTCSDLLPEEKRLLLPIRLRGADVAILRLDGVEPSEIAPLLSLLPRLAGLCLEKTIAGMGRDSQTGLESEEKFLEELASRIARGRAGEISQNCLGLIVIDLPEAGAGPGSTLRRGVMEALPRIAGVILQNMADAALAGRLDKFSGNFVFAVLFPASSRSVCQRLAARLAHALENIGIAEPLSGACVPLRASAGHALYPHDLSGHELNLSAFEQGLLIRDRARLAAAAAWNADNLATPVTAWAWIPTLCCSIREIVGHRLARLNYGANAGIRENQRYLVIPRGAPREAASARAQLVIRKAGEKDALAEVIHATTAGWQPEPGDYVILMRESQDLASGIESQGHFLESLKNRTDSRFALAISRLIGAPSQGGQARLRSACVSLLPENAFAGHYGADGVIICLPGAGAAEAEKLLSELHGRVAGSGLELASGIFAYPFLNFGRDESEMCALKALAYAELLPAPRIGCLNAYALAISADKRFSNGDETGALEEYRQALLLNPEDAMLLNSLGVCLAALNRNGEARRSFGQALRTGAEPGLRARICYNLGNLYLKDNYVAEARSCFRQAVKADSGHIFAWTRLARTHELAGQANMARALYRHAGRLAGADAAALNMIQRQLARLEKENEAPEKAREILHDSLVRDPSDTASLLLLAETYIRDDPAMAESLARKCLALGKSARDVLSAALAAQARIAGGG